ncbi:MAG TPA: hypothetical protein VM934_01530 [Pyrinomonadaceae bacterium]|jgi:hypothetical protein|nr:hypothetical protein [Pyrinomonadaceae bacterium]
MNTVAGIFKSRADAVRAVEQVQALGIAQDRINFLTPGETHQDLDAEVPTTETEQPGMGKALGGAVGGALGVAGGLPLGAAAASLFIPGVGPILAAGLVGAALLGIGGAATGMAAGGAMEDSVAPELPHDELYVYEDALRQGRTVLIVMAEDGAQAESVRDVLTQAGAESLDAARESWWVGLRDAEESEYTAEGRDFKSDEQAYRRGFEASLHPAARGKSYDEDNTRLRECYGDTCTAEAFRRGYERGQNYHRTMAERYRN